jgi:hypothetical protein
LRHFCHWIRFDPGLRAPEMPLDVDSIAADARLLEEIG